MSTIPSIRQASRQMVRELDVLKGVFRDSGFTYSQCHLLFELEQHRLLNLAELSQILLLDKSNTSRVVNKLIERDLIKVNKTAADKRQKLYSLTPAGEKAAANNNCLANKQVDQAVHLLSDTEQTIISQGLALYAKALRQSRLQSEFNIRPIRPEDNPQVARIIRDVMTEFQAVGQGYSINDPEVDQMYEAYQGQNACFYVLEKNERLLGCGGIAPLKGAEQQICELQKMYFFSETRGLGLGKKLVYLLLEEARKRNYQQCYLETLERMWQANLLYQKVGFQKIDGPLGNTGHCSCDAHYLLDL
ncbi:MAG: bifunctional helix-turn-helix transcriptional regulator/GNAT family N-acetyltransferase [Bacteroidota bacterium]